MYKSAAVEEITSYWNKVAFSLSPEGHAYDAAVYRAAQKANEGILGAKGEYAEEAPIKAHLLGIDPIIGGMANRLSARNFNYAANKHDAGRNALNPFGGLMTPTEGEKRSFSLTDEGHKYDSEEARQMANLFDARLNAKKEYTKESPIKSYALGMDPYIGGLADRLVARHQNYRAKLHGAGENPMNPFGGLLTRTPGGN